MRPLAPPSLHDANLPLISLIIGRRSNIFVIDALNRLFWTQIKNDSRDVCAFRQIFPRPTIFYLRVKLRSFDMGSIEDFDTRKHAR